MSNPYKCQNPLFLANETPPCNVTNNDSQFRKKIHHLQFLLKQIDLAHEGFWSSYSYANSLLSEELRAEGAQQKKLYLYLFSEALDGVHEIEQAMVEKSGTSMEVQ